MVFVQNALKEGGVAFCDFPVVAHFSESFDQGSDGGIDVVVDCGAMYEEQASGDPEAESERGAEFGEHVVGADVAA